MSSLVARPVTCAERARERGGAARRARRRSGAASWWRGEVGLEQPGEAAVELHLGVVGRRARSVRVASYQRSIHSSSDGRAGGAASSAAARVGRPRELGAERRDHARRARASSPRRHHDRAARRGRPAASPGVPRRGAAEQHLVAEAHDRAVEVLAPARRRAPGRGRSRVTVPGATGTVRAVDAVLPAPAAQPDQLVVVVAVRLADRLAAPQSRSCSTATPSATSSRSMVSPGRPAAPGRVRLTSSARPPPRASRRGS